MAGLEPASERFFPRTSTSVGVLWVSRRGRGNIRPARRQSLEPEGPLSHGARRPVRHSDIVTPASPPVRGRGGQTSPYKKAIALSLKLMQRGALRHRKCYWHLIFCAEFTRSAPLGSQSGASLSRRSLSSPNTPLLYPEKHPKCAGESSVNI